MSANKTPIRVYDLVLALWRKKFGINKAKEDKLSLLDMLQDLLKESS